MTDEKLPEQPGSTPAEPAKPVAAPDPKSPVKPASKAADKPVSDPSSRTDGPDPLRGSRASGIWAGVVALGIVLVLLIIFISQNTQEVSVAFLSWEGQAPLSVALLAAAAGGLFLTVAAGTVRILQLRHRVRVDKKRARKK